MRITILGSGSEGNALLLETGDTRVLVDAGLSFRKLSQRFEAIGRTMPSDVSAVLVTHGHGDHAAHASTYAARLGCPIRTTEATARTIRVHRAVEVETFRPGGSFRIGELSIRSRRVPHDAPQVALVFESPDSSLGLVTDLGHVPSGLAGFLDGCETLLLESNYDPDMLASGPYPESLKRRVHGRLGHLSNGHAGDLLAKLPSTPRHVVLMHLSQTNNTPHLARLSAEAALGHQDVRLTLAKQHEVTELGTVHRGQLQLSL